MYNKMYCPHTYRTVEDPGCLYVTFRNPEENYRIKMESAKIYAMPTTVTTKLCGSWEETLAIVTTSSYKLKDMSLHEPNTFKEVYWDKR